MEHVLPLDGPHTNNNAEGWHSNVRKLAGKAHPNIYEAVELFKVNSYRSELNAACSWRTTSQEEKEVLTIKEKYEADDYTLSELVKAFSNWV